MDFELAMPWVNDRAHTPPRGYRTFYKDQVDMGGLRFFIPKLIYGICKYYGVSPSQLFPNSYSTFLSLGILWISLSIVLPYG